jgi:adenylylsulfate kinase-like enzyme
VREGSEPIPYIFETLMTLYKTMQAMSSGPSGRISKVFCASSPPVCEIQHDEVRRQVREMIEPVGGFVLVHVATSIEVCEQRDRKGLYATARAGIIKEFTGISDPYETPTNAEVVINTADLSPKEAAQEIILHLEGQGFIGVNGRPE